MTKTKSRRGTKDNPITINSQELAAIIDGPVRDYVIQGAAINDGYCHYQYEITGGVGIGNPHSVKGKHVILDTMRDAFVKFNVHLANLDDAFKIANHDVEDIDTLHGDEITCRYTVTGFKTKGTEENLSVSLIGIKYSSIAQGRIALTTPFIALDKLSSYKFYNELKDAVDKARLEVSLYHEGNYRMEEDDDDEEEGGKKKKARQLTIASPEGAAEIAEGEKVMEDDIDDFANAAI